MATEKNIIQLHTESGTNNYVNKTDWHRKSQSYETRKLGRTIRLLLIAEAHLPFGLSPANTTGHMDSG